MNTNEMYDARLAKRWPSAYCPDIFIRGAALRDTIHRPGNAVGREFVRDFMDEPDDDTSVVYAIGA